MGAYKRDVVVVIKIIFMGCLICVVAHYPNFTVMQCFPYFYSCEFLSPVSYVCSKFVEQV